MIRNTVLIFSDTSEEHMEEENPESDEEENNEVEETATERIKRLSDDEYITPEEVKKHFVQLWNTENKAMKCLFGAYKVPEALKKVTTPEIFFLDVLAVPPVRFRPVSCFLIKFKIM